jgi:hypothetical protein
MRSKKRARGIFLRLDNPSTRREDDDFDRLVNIRLSHRPLGRTSHCMTSGYSEA